MYYFLYYLLYVLYILSMSEYILKPADTCCLFVFTVLSDEDIDPHNQDNHNDWPAGILVCKFMQIMSIMT